MENYITIDSFGAEVPANWEQIAAYLNEIIDRRGISEDHNAVNELWEAYWAGDLPGSPAAVQDGKVINKAGKEIDFQAAVELMDDDIREALHSEGYETEQEFFAAYEAAHAAKYGEEWELSKSNPQY